MLCGWYWVYVCVCVFLCVTSRGGSGGLGGGRGGGGALGGPGQQGVEGHLQVVVAVQQGLAGRLPVETQLHDVP